MLFEQRNIVGFSKMTILPIKPGDKNKDYSCSKPLHAYSLTFENESSNTSVHGVLCFSFTDQLSFLYKFVEIFYRFSIFWLHIQAVNLMCFVFQLIVITRTVDDATIHLKVARSRVLASCWH